MAKEEEEEEEEEDLFFWFFRRPSHFVGKDPPPRSLVLDSP